MISDGLKENLDNIEQFIRDRNQDWVFATVGGEGTGKSALSLEMARYIDGRDFDPEKQVAFSAEEFRQKAAELEPFRPIVFDEGIEGLYASDHMKKENKKTVRFLRKCREMNLFIFINIPVYDELSKKIRQKRVKSVMRCVKQGWMHFYGKNAVKQVNDRDNYPDASARFAWSDPEDVIPHTWNTYQEAKLEDINSLNEQEDQDVDWLKPSEFGDKVGVSRYTVNNWANDGKIKYHTLPNGEKRIPASEVDEIIEDPVKPDAK